MVAKNCQQVVSEVLANAERRRLVRAAAQEVLARRLHRAEIALEHRTPIAGPARGAPGEYRAAVAHRHQGKITRLVIAHQESLGSGGQETNVVHEDSLHRRGEEQALGAGAGRQFQPRVGSVGVVGKRTVRAGIGP
jgi:hypothetical protein